MFGWSLSKYIICGTVDDCIKYIDSKELFMLKNKKSDALDQIFKIKLDTLRNSEWKQISTVR